MDVSVDGTLCSAEHKWEWWAFKQKKIGMAAFGKRSRDSLFSQDLLICYKSVFTCVVFQFFSYNLKWEKERKGKKKGSFQLSIVRICSQHFLSIMFPFLDVFS